MTTPPGDTHTAEPAEPPHDPGPRVSGAEVRDLASLRRSRADRKVAGVAAGIARHLDVDPIIIRVALVVLIFFGGAGLIVYGACWLLVPADGASRATVRLDDRSRTVALALVGVLAALALLGDSLGGFGFPWPLALIGLVLVLVLAFRGRHDTDPAAGSSYPPPPPPPPRPPEGSAPSYSPLAPARARRVGPLLFWYTLALIAIGTGVLGSIELAGVDVAPSAYPALALVTSGLMLVVGSSWGRPGGLIALGLVSAVATAAVTAGSELDAGRMELTPLTASAVAPDYDLDAGEILLDLTEVSDLDALDGRVVDLEVGLGRVEVVVPDGLDVIVESDLGVGDRTVFGNDSEGGRATDTLDGGPDAPVLRLDVRVGLGDIDIVREGES